MSPTTFTVDGIAYQAGRLSAFQQFHLLRRLMPLADMWAHGRGRESEADWRRIARAVAALSDADADFVLLTCLGVVERRQPGGRGWSPVLSREGRVPMFDDMGAATLVHIVARVLAGVLADFSAALPGLIAALRPSPAPDGLGCPVGKTG